MKGTASSGNPDADAEAAFGQFVAANLQPTGAVWLMSSTNALALSMRKNALGQKEYPDMTLLVSMFQTGSVAIRAERWINWRRRRTAAVAVITGVNYGSASGG
ncbi:TPA: hypothetical protein HI057_25810 [Escherichia coli]|nr:hypothetical protein [Escherichia coli]